MWRWRRRSRWVLRQGPIGALAPWKRAVTYQQCFGTEAGQVVFRDLLRCARFGDPHWVTGDEGRNREILGMQKLVLRIARHLEADMEMLFREAAKEGLKHDQQNSAIED